MGTWAWDLESKPACLPTPTCPESSQPFFLLKFAERVNYPSLAVGADHLFCHWYGQLERNLH